MPLDEERFRQHLTSVDAELDDDYNPADGECDDGCVRGMRISLSGRSRRISLSGRSRQIAAAVAHLPEPQRTQEADHFKSCLNDAVARVHEVSRECTR